MRSLGFTAVASAMWLLVVGTLIGCNPFPESFQCTSNGQCTRRNVTGTCANNACAFEDRNCRSGLSFDSTAPSNLQGQCVPAGTVRDSGPAGDGALRNDCGGTGTLPGRVADPCGACLLGRYVCDSPDTLRCDGAPTRMVVVSGEGTVTASSTYGGAYRAPLIIDGDLSTSWFSSGPEADGEPTTLDWALPSRECIVGISFAGNAMHREFPTGFGFDSMTAQVLDSAGGVQFSSVKDLSGSPDPDTNITLEANGVRVRLLLAGHESTECGGFSELAITVARP